jgi:hypothetical protein
MGGTERRDSGWGKREGMIALKIEELLGDGVGVREFSTTTERAGVQPKSPVKSHIPSSVAQIVR